MICYICIRGIHCAFQVHEEQEELQHYRHDDWWKSVPKIKSDTCFFRIRMGNIGSCDTRRQQRICVALRASPDLSILPQYNSAGFCSSSRFTFGEDGAHSVEMAARCEPPIVRCSWCGHMRLSAGCEARQSLLSLCDVPSFDARWKTTAGWISPRREPNRAIVTVTLSRPANPCYNTLLLCRRISKSVQVLLPS